MYVKLKEKKNYKKSQKKNVKVLLWVTVVKLFNSRISFVSFFQDIFTKLLSRKR